MRYVGTDQACLILLFMNHVHGELYQKLLAGAYIMSPMGYLGGFDANIGAALGVFTSLFTGKAGAARAEVAFWDPERHAAFFNFCGRVSPDACLSLLQYITGPSPDVDKTHLIDVARNMFDSTSNNTSLYIASMSGKPKHLTLFDYGAAENQRRYKTSTPPALRLDRTTVKCSFFPVGQTNDFKPADALDTFNALAKSAQSHYQVLQKYSSMSPFAPIDTDGIYGVVVARYELELGQTKH